MRDSITGPIIAAIEATWSRIRDEHSDVPEVVVTIAGGSGKGGLRLGHFAPDRWARGDERMHELFIGGEGLRRGGLDVLGTLLHEAAHGAAQTRGIKDTSRQGRYHNARFRDLGAEFGLTLEKDARIGWSLTNVPAHTADCYAAEVAALGRALTVYRIGEFDLSPTGSNDNQNADNDGEGNDGTPKKNKNGVSAACECGRKLRASQTVMDAGPILCGLCGSKFAA